MPGARGVSSEVEDNRCDFLGHLPRRGDLDEISVRSREFDCPLLLQPAAGLLCRHPHSDARHHGL